MIKLKIENYLEDHEWDETKYVDGEYLEYTLSEVIDADLDRIKNGKVYEFNNLKEVKEFLNSCKIDFTDEYAKYFGQWSWEEIDTNLDISMDEDNLLIYVIDCHPEWID